MLGPVPYSVAGGTRGSMEPSPRPGDVGGTRWVVVRGQHHGPLTLAHIRWVSVACAGQVDALPAGMPDRRRWGSVLRGRALLGCTRGSSWARSARPGLSLLTAAFAAVGLTPLVGSSGERR